MSDEQYGEGTRNTTLSMGQSEEHGLHRMRQFQDGVNNIVGKGNGVMVNTVPSKVADQNEDVQDNAADIVHFCDQVVKEKTMPAADGKLQTEIIPQLGDINVASLFKADGMNWEEEILNDLFEQGDVEKILNIPLSNRDTPDYLYWGWDERGDYSVRSCYRAQQITHLQIEEAKWTSMWNLKILPKVKNLLWTACADCLSTAEALWKKFVPCRLECIHNDADMESTLHIFAECKVAKACYRLAKLNIRVEGFTNFKEWFGHNLSSLCIEKQSVLAMLCWALWEARNHKIWNNITLTPRAIVEDLAGEGAMPLPKPASHAELQFEESARQFSIYNFHPEQICENLERRARSRERRVSDLKNRVGKLRSEIEIEATAANIEEPSHSNDLAAAIKCLQDSFVDVNFVGDVCFKVRKAEVVLRDLMAILSEYDEPETNTSTSSAAAVKPFKASLDPDNPLGFLETTLEFLAREFDLFNSNSLINDVNAVVRMVKDKVDTEERKRKQKEKSANGNIEKKMKEPPIIAAAPAVPVKEVEVEGEKTTGTTEDVAYAVVLVLDAGMIPRTSTTPYIAIETPLNPRSVIDQEAFDRWKGHAALTLRATMFLMSQGLTHETVSWFDSYCNVHSWCDRVFIYRLIRLSALELVSKAVKMAVGTDLIKMMNPIVVNRYKRFSKGGLAAQIAASPLSAPIDMSVFESKYKDPSSIKWTVNTTSEKSVELMSMRIPTNELLMVLLQLEMETS
nr:protein BOBBER 1-like [Ipomoea batatas]